LPKRKFITMKWNLFSLIEKGMEYMALVTPNLIVGVEGYTLFLKFFKGWMFQ
jgi:hypothetical protein